MKIKLKKMVVILSTSIASAGVVVGGSALAIKNDGLSISLNSNETVNNFKKNEISTFDPNKSLTFKGKKYPNIYAAIEEFVNTDGNVTEELFLGNISNAIINSAGGINGYKTVDLSKLKKYDVTKLSKAYKTASDNYTPSLEDAKRSYLREPRVAWTDNNGLLFDTQLEAEEFISKNTSTVPIAYYEIEDYSDLNIIGKPNVVRINPLNPQDLVALKKLAIDNIFIDNSKFELKRFTANSSEEFYQVKNFVGKTFEEIQSIAKSLTRGITDIVKKNMWLNVGVSPTMDNPYIDYSEMVYTPSPSGGMIYKPTPSTYQAGFDAYFENDSASTPTSYEAIVRDSGMLLDKNKIVDIMELKNSGRHDRVKDALLRPGKELFGHKKAEFKFPTHKLIEGGDQPDHLKKPEAISFSGRGSYRNVFFTLNVNQNNFPEWYLKNKSEWDKKVDEAIASAEKYIKEEFKKHSISDQVASTLVDNLKSPLTELLTSRIINKDELTVHKAKDNSVLLAKLDGLNDLILNLLNMKMSNNSKNLSSFIIDSLSDSYLTSEAKNSSEVIYLVTYNGHELFKIENDLFQELYDDKNSPFRTNPLSAIKKFIKEMLASNYSDNIQKIMNAMINVSNNFTREEKPDVQVVKTNLSREAVDKYKDEKNKINTFNFAKHEVTSGFDPKYQSMFIDSHFSQYGATIDGFKKGLNYNESDSQALLFSQWGTFEAIHQYNKNLQDFLTKNKVPTAIQLKELEKNAVTDLNNIVSLFETNGTPKQIKYSEYFDNSYKFNQSVSGNNAKIITSLEEKNKYIETNKLNKPTKVIVVKDLDDNILNFSATDGTTVDGDGYATSKEQAMMNAMNLIDIKEDLKKVYYENPDGTKDLIDNTTTKLNVLKITTNTTTQRHGFLSGQDLYNYLFEFIKVNSTGNGTTVIDPTVVPFDATTIDYAKIKKELSGVTDLDTINKLDSESKFKRFGSAFNISNLNEWNMYIDELTFTEIKSRSDIKYADMFVKLKSGFKFSDGNTYIKVPIEYEMVDIDDGVNIEKSNRNKVIATVASVTSSILAIIILEAILITTIMINKKSRATDSERKLLRLIKNN